jgi:serine protease AprX
MVSSSSKILIFFLFIYSSAWSQKDRYMVFFTDKAGTPYQVDEPNEFLSAKAVERRVKQNIAVTEFDIPVNANYIASIKETGAEVYFPTRWMNGVLIQSEASLIPNIKGLSFVARVEMVAPGASLVQNGRRKAPGRSKGIKAAVTDVQLQMIGIDKMHQDGIKGAGITIAILDAGFSGVDVSEPFQHLRDEGRIDMSLSKDFVYNSENIFQYDEHGTEVFSVVGALSPGLFTGGAPEASFQLYVTEEVPTEYRVEEYNWLFAAERADSAGVDIIQSSLGYNDFDGTSMDYLKSQMDGETAVVTRAAQMAADRGIVVVVSAGNEGNISWQIVTAPADAVDVLAVGSVNANLQRAGSSSTGPTSDNRIKPDVAALGVNTSVILSSGSTGKASGTSLAAPLITSLVAGILQKFPALTNKEVMDAIRSTSSMATNPDMFLGYGIPSYESIVGYLNSTGQTELFAIYPNPSFVDRDITDTVIIRPLNPEEISTCRIEFISADGKSVIDNQFVFSKENAVFRKDVTQLTDGIYYIRINWRDRNYIYRYMKVK